MGKIHFSLMERDYHIQTLESNQGTPLCMKLSVQALRLVHWLLLQKPMLKCLIVSENVQSHTNEISFCISPKCVGQVFLFGQHFMYEIHVLGRRKSPPFYLLFYLHFGSNSKCLDVLF